MIVSMDAVHYIPRTESLCSLRRNIGTTYTCTPLGIGMEVRVPVTWIDTCSSRLCLQYDKAAHLIRWVVSVGIVIEYVDVVLTTVGEIKSGSESVYPTTAGAHIMFSALDGKEQKKRALRELCGMRSVIGVGSYRKRLKVNERAVSSTKVG